MRHLLWSRAAGWRPCWLQNPATSVAVAIETVPPAVRFAVAIIWLLSVEEDHSYTWIRWSACCVLVCMAVSQFLLFLLFLNKQAGKSSHLGHYLTSNNNVTNFIQPLNVLLIKMKKKNIIPVIFTCWNYTQAQNGASVRRHRPARSSGMHRECCDFCIWQGWAVI